MTLRSLPIVVLVSLGMVSPLAAQTPPPVTIPSLAPAVALRPYVLLAGQRSAAPETFDAVFGTTLQPFLGGGAQLAFANGLYTEVAISRFRKAGERAFLLDGESFKLGIPLEATIIPIEITGGYRFGAEWSSLVVPYVGVGLAAYRYTETADFAEAGDDINLRGTGYLAVGGAEFRLHRWVVASADVQYTRVAGILGQGGVSEQAGEDNLGGVSARFRVMIGR
jgi:hypothetical protein